MTLPPRLRAILEVMSDGVERAGTDPCWGGGYRGSVGLRYLADVGLVDYAGWVRPKGKLYRNRSFVINDQGRAALAASVSGAGS